MVLVTNTPVRKDGCRVMSYDEFCRQAFHTPEGIDPDDYIINVADISQEVYEAVKSFDIIHYFRLGDGIPDFIDKFVDDFSDLVQTPVPTANAPEKQHNHVSHESDEDLGEVGQDVLTLMGEEATDYFEPDMSDKGARIVAFGSSKGGTGKTFTAIMSTYIYAKAHPEQRIALIDFDVIDGQVGISIHKVNPTVRNYYSEFQKGHSSYDMMRKFAVKGNSVFPQNVDFYLAPPNGAIIPNKEFWANIVSNCCQNYDVVVFDTGIDYLNIEPISYAYKIADKIILTTTTSIKSVNSVCKQVRKLTGAVENGVYTPEDGLASRVNIAITQMVPENKLNNQVFSTLAKEAPVIATFGVITNSVSKAEYFGEWDVFDGRDKKDIRNAFIKLME